MSETQHHDRFLKWLDDMKSDLDTSHQRHVAAGDEFEAILDRIRANVTQIFRPLLVVDRSKEEWHPLIFSRRLERISDSWKRALDEALAHDDHETTVKERAKLDTLGKIRQKFLALHPELRTNERAQPMDAHDTIRILKALADRSRLLLVNSLMEKPRYVEELAERLGLAPSTVSFHLKKLEEAGLVTSAKEQYYVVYTLRTELLERPLGHLLILEEKDRKPQTDREELYRQKVLKAFFRYGKLTKIPVQWKKRLIVLEEIARRFEVGHKYRERDVNLIIADFHDDFCTIRRDMIDAKLMARERGIYWLVEARNP